MTESRVEFPSADGTRLVGVLVEPDGHAPGKAVLAHGITVEKHEDGFYTDLAEELANAGIASLRFDFRGHGESGGDAEGMTIQGEIDDLAAAVSRVQGGALTPLALVATSFGAGVAVLYTARQPSTVSCLALLCPVLDYRRTFLAPETEWAREWFTSQAIEQAYAVGTFNLNGFSLGRKLFDEFRSLDPATTLLTLDVPTLIAHGTDDSMVPFAVSAEVAAKRKAIHFLPVQGADHGFEGSESLVYSEVRAWLLNHLAE